MASGARLSTALLLAALVMPMLVPSGLAEGEPGDFVMFTRPSPFKRLVADPWADGLWMPTDSGAFFWSPDAIGLRQISLGEGLPTRSVNDVAPRPDEVWLAHFRGMSVMSRATGEFTDVKAADGSVLNVLLRSVRIAGQTAWSAAEDKGLYRTDLSTKVAVYVPNPVNGSAWTDPVYDVWVDGKDAFISVINYGLVHWNLETGEAKVHKHNLLSAVPMYYRLHVTPRYVFIGSNGDGLVRFDRTNEAMIEFVGPQNTNSPVVSGMIQLGSELWMGTVSGVTRYDMRDQSWKNWQTVPGHAGVDLAVYKGQVFVVTKEGQVAIYDRAQDVWNVPSWWKAEDRPVHNGIRGCDHDQQRLAFGTGGGGANFYDPSTRRWSAAGLEPGDTGSPRDILVYATASDQHERWYAHAKGLSRHNLSNGQWTDYRTDGRNPVISQPVWTFDVEMTPTDVWAATQSNSPDSKNGGVWQPGNLARLDRSKDQWTYYGPADGLADENVSVVAADGQRIWVGTFRGVDVFDTSDDSIRHVFPDAGIVPVYAIRPSADTVWVGAAGRFYAIEKSTLQESEVPALRGKFIRSLETAGGDVFVGTDTGLFRYQPSTGLAQEIRRGPTSLRVFCLVAQDGVLYVGTPYGVERLLLATLGWLPQVEYFGTDGVVPPPSQDVKISITSPKAQSVVAPATTLTVAGSSQGPAGSTVEVRFGNGVWVPASGATTWTAQIDPGNPPPGTAYVSARLRWEQRTLVQTSVPVRVEWPQGSGPTQFGGFAAYHDPVQEAVEGEDVHFRVDVTPDSSDLGGMLSLVGNDGARIDLQLVRTDAGRLEATLPSIGAGVWTYTLRIEAGGSSVTLPSSEDNFGESYLLAARAASSSVTIGGSTKILTIAPRQTTTFKLAIGNSLPRAADLHLTAGGEAGSWVAPLSTVRLEPNHPAQLVNLTITPPKGKTLGVAELVLRGTVDGFPAAQPSVRLTLTIGTSTAVAAGQNANPADVDGPEAGAAPGPGILGLLAVMVAVSIGLDYRRRGP
jgi:ligand-binding sensor domain-containing protein